MRLITKTAVALGFVGAMSLGAASPAPAQGFYFSGPGVSIGVGGPWRHRYYRNYAYDPYWYGGPRVYARPYWRHHHSWHRW
jgi:hypothetical protein